MSDTFSEIRNSVSRKGRKMYEKKKGDDSLNNSKIFSKDGSSNSSIVSEGGSDESNSSNSNFTNSVGSGDSGSEYKKID
jgi:hypothetical protein